MTRTAIDAGVAHAAASWSVMAEGAAVRALRESLRTVRASDLDRAAVQLARRYAGLLDAATPASKYRPMLDRIAAALARTVDADDAAEALAKIRDALGAHSVASDLGPKYLAVLTALGLTPAARGAKATPAPAAEGKRNELKERRDQRERDRAAGTR